MNKKDILSCLREDEKEQNGEILEVKKDGVLYYDYGYGNEVFFISTKYCTRNFVASKIFVGEKSNSMGVDIELLTNVLCHAFKDFFPDAFSTFRGCVVFGNKKEFEKGIKTILPNEDFSELMEEFEYEDMDNCVGKLWYRKQIIFVNEKLIRKLAKENKDDYLYDFVEEYSRGILMTIIHEMRHCMFTNCFLPEDSYPEYLESEEEVENFCINAYESLPYSLKLINVPKDSLDKKKYCA